MPEFSQHPDRNVSLRVSDAVVQLVREYTGRGPVSARTTIDRDAVYVFMRGTLTRGEVRLVGDGHEGEVLALRSAFQAAMRTDLTAIIEEVLARRVEAFMSTNHTDPDCAVEIFVLGDQLATAAAPTVVEITA